MENAHATFIKSETYYIHIYHFRSLVLRFMQLLGCVLL